MKDVEGGLDSVVGQEFDDWYEQRARRTLFQEWYSILTHHVLQWLWFNIENDGAWQSIYLVSTLQDGLRLTRRKEVTTNLTNGSYRLATGRTSMIR